MFTAHETRFFLYDKLYYIYIFKSYKLKEAQFENEAAKIEITEAQARREETLGDLYQSELRNKVQL